MVSSRLLPALGVIVLGGLASLAAAATGLGWNADALSLELSSIDQLPAAPAGVTELKFSEFFKSPVGPRGLEFTDKLKALDGRRVRILGFMIQQEQTAHGLALLAPFAFTTHEDEYGLCDDLPSTLVFVNVPKFKDTTVPYTPGMLLLTGRLEVGPREMADGRVSQVRLTLDPEPPAGAPLVVSPGAAKAAK